MKVQQANSSSPVTSSLPLKRAARAGLRSVARPAAVQPDTAEREQMIREAAYFYFEARGEGEGDQVQDWLRAEADVERQLAGPADESTGH